MIGSARAGGMPAIALVAACLSVGCHSLNLAPAPGDKPNKAVALAPPSKYSFRVSQFAFLSDFELAPDQPLFQELSDLRDQVYKELSLPGMSTLVQVYIFEDRAHYEAFMHARYPDLPRRRAFFVAQPRTVGSTEDLLVFTYWGDRIREDLRHELTHALLHSVLRDVPLWLDEGLAEYFELPPGADGVNPHHLDQLRSGPDGSFKPDLAHLEDLNQVQQMTPMEYREAWAWVHLMLHDRAEAKAVLTGYLQQLRANPAPGPLQAKLVEVYPHPEEALNKHLAKLEAPKPSTPTAQR
jgi:hypothetical protein